MGQHEVYSVLKKDEWLSLKEIMEKVNTRGRSFELHSVNNSLRKMLDFNEIKVKFKDKKTGELREPSRYNFVPYNMIRVFRRL